MSALWISMLDIYFQQTLSHNSASKKDKELTGVNRGPDANRYLGTLLPNTTYPPEHICNLRSSRGLKPLIEGELNSGLPNSRLMVMTSSELFSFYKIIHFDVPRRGHLHRFRNHILKRCMNIVPTYEHDSRHVLSIRWQVFICSFMLVEKLKLIIKIFL